VIVVDTSALMSLLLAEPDAETIADILVNSTDLSISAVTLAEARIVAARRDLASEMDDLVEGLRFDVETVTDDTARRVAGGLRNLGKGHPPGCAELRGLLCVCRRHVENAPLLYVGEDFARTDVQSALPRNTSN
jgi:ribonuclease VapC